MSRQSLMLFVSVIAIALAASRAEDSSWTQAGSRAPSSLKKEWTMMKEPLMHKHTEKLRGPLAVSVELVGAAPEKAGDVFALKGVISSEQALSNVEFGWNLGPGVEVVSGEVASVIAYLKSDDVFETTLTLRQVSDRDARVALKARGRDGGMRFGDAAAYNTLKQDKIEVSRKALQKSVEVYAEEEKRLKIFH